MSYLDYLKSITTKTDFARKEEYVEYNFKRYIPGKKKNQISILEIGPGLGEAISYFNKTGINQIDIVDNSIEVIDYLKNKFLIRNAYYQNVLSLDQKLGNYDLILLTQVLEHVQKKDSILWLQLLYKHLNKDGTILITVPNMANSLGLYNRYYDFTHETGYTENSLRELVSQSNLENILVEFQEFGIPPSNIINFLRICVQKIFLFFVKIMYMVNGSVIPQFVGPNITLVIKKNVT